MKVASARLRIGKELGEAGYLVWLALCDVLGFGGIVFAVVKGYRLEEAVDKLVAMVLHHAESAGMGPGNLQRGPGEVPVLPDAAGPAIAARKGSPFREDTGMSA